MMTQAQFQRSYSFLLGSVWANPNTAAQLMSDAASVLKKAGFDFPAGEKINIQWTHVANDAAGGLADAYKSYLADVKNPIAGITLYIPVTPVDPMANIDSGGTLGANDTSYCCCCCPCCTCT